MIEIIQELEAMSNEELVERYGSLFRDYGARSALALPLEGEHEAMMGLFRDEIRKRMTRRHG